MTKRNILNHYLDFDDSRVLDAPLDHVIAQLTEIMRLNPEKPNLGLSLECDGYDRSSLVLRYTSLETDEELAERLETEAYEKKRLADEAKKATRRAADLKEFNRLKVKLGK